MRAYAQRDGLRQNIQVAPSVEHDEEWKFRNSFPCTMPQSLANAHCSGAVQWRYQNRRTQDLDAKWSLHLAEFC